MIENRENILLYKNQIKSIIVTINYILLMWDDIKNNDFYEMKNGWESIDCEIFINKYLENEISFNRLKELHQDFEILYKKLFETD